MNYALLSSASMVLWIMHTWHLGYVFIDHASIMLWLTFGLYVNEVIALERVSSCDFCDFHFSALCVFVYGSTSYTGLRLCT